MVAGEVVGSEVVASEVLAGEVLARSAETRIAISVPVEDPDDPAYRVAPGDYSGVVELALLEGDACTGALLTSGRHILTAAHCFEAVEHNGRPTYFPDPAQVSVIFHLADATYPVAVRAIYVYPGWQNVEGSNGDLAVVELVTAAPAEATRYELYRRPDEVGRVFTRVGFGQRATGRLGEVDVAEDDPAPVMRFGQNRYEALGEVFNEPDTEPDSKVNPGQQLVYDYDSGLPANDAFGREFDWPDIGLGKQEIGASGGDSGGPAFIDGKVAGISSTGLSPELAGVDVTWPNDTSFGEYFFDTRVSAFASYIDRVMAGRVPVPPGTATPAVPEDFGSSMGWGAGILLVAGIAVGAVGIWRYRSRQAG